MRDHMNVVSYIRVSGKGQLAGDGPARQRDSIADFVRGNKLAQLWEFFEKGVSGTTEGMDRAAFSDMISFIEAAPVTATIQAIVVERLDRLARDLMVQEFLLKECRDRGIQVFAADVGLVDQATNEGDPTRKLIRQVLGAVAEFAKSELVMKLAKARKRMRETTGRCEGRKPFGHENKSEQHVLSAIRGYANTSLTMEEIAALLNEGELRTRTGRQWTRQNLRSVMENAGILKK